MTLYLWIKALHIIGVVCWFAGIFYLPRLFVYHAASEDQISRDRFEVMESKLYRIIMRPSMIASLVLGIWLMVLTWQSYGACVWLWTKIALVVALLGFHHFCGVTIRRFTGNENPNGEKFFRIVNEVPSLLLILIVILAVVKPF